MSTADPPPILLPNFSDEETEEKDKLSFRSKWFKIIEDYTDTSFCLRFRTGPNCWGMPGSLFCGLFEGIIPFALLWFRVRPTTVDMYNASTPRRPMKYRAPSWSWASVEGKVSYDNERIENWSPVESTSEQLDWGEFLLCKVIEDSQGESR